MVEAVLFDVDGTLIDSVDLHAKAWQDAFAHFGMDLCFEDVRAQIGKDGDQLMPVFLSKEDLEQRGEELEAYRGRLFKGITSARPQAARTADPSGRVAPSSQGRVSSSTSGESVSRTRAW